MIESRTVAVAQCDACGHVNYADDNGDFRAGFAFTLVDFEAQRDVHVTAHDVYACRATHIGKASKAVLDRSVPDPPWDPASPVPDAPPLPTGED